MKCPYCAEEIKEEALVCTHCNRDFTLIKPILEKLGNLESRISATQRQVTDILKNLSSVRYNSMESRSSNMKYYRRATILLVGLAVGSTLLITKTENIIPIMILLLSPLIIGIWLGLIVPYMHLGVYALIGGIGGVAAFITVVIALGGGIQWSGIIPVGFFIISFSTGGLIGDWIERKRSPIRPTAAFAEKIARGVVGSTNSPSPQVESKVKRLADIFAALGPLLSLIGTIIAAYFAFRASILPK